MEMPKFYYGDKVKTKTGWFSSDDYPVLTIMRISPNPTCRFQYSAWVDPEDYNKGNAWSAENDFVLVERVGDPESWRRYRTPVQCERITVAIWKALDAVTSSADGDWFFNEVKEILENEEI